MLTRRWWMAVSRGHAAGDADGGLKGHVQQRAGGLALGGRLVGLFHLGQDLRFAQHHAVQAGGHAEQVPHGRFIGADEQVRHDLAGIELMEAGEELPISSTPGIGADWLAA